MAYREQHRSGTRPAPERGTRTCPCPRSARIDQIQRRQAISSTSSRCGGQICTAQNQRMAEHMEKDRSPSAPQGDVLGNPTRERAEKHKVSARKPQNECIDLTGDRCPNCCEGEQDQRTAYKCRARFSLRAVKVVTSHHLEILSGAESQQLSFKRALEANIRPFRQTQAKVGRAISSTPTVVARAPTVAKHRQSLSEETQRLYLGKRATTSYKPASTKRSAKRNQSLKPPRTHRPPSPVDEEPSSVASGLAEAREAIVSLRVQAGETELIERSVPSKASQFARTHS